MFLERKQKIIYKNVLRLKATRLIVKKNERYDEQEDVKNNLKLTGNGCRKKTNTELK